MKHLTQSLKDPWRQMIVVDTALMIGLFIYKALYHNPGFQYLHLIIDYHFGFAKRALVGTAVSFLLPEVPVWFVYVLGGAVWLLTLALFLRVFQKTFGLSAATTPLFAFVFGSPFFLKNFVQSVGYFDIYGCLLALSLLLLPTRSFLYVVVAALGSIVLILIHPLHMLLYVPTVALIVALRFYFVSERSASQVVAGIVLAVAVGATFVLVILYGAMPVPMEQLIPYLRERTADKNYPLSPEWIEVWYRPISDDIARTWNVMPENVRRLPVFALLIALHWPLIAYFRRLIQALARRWHRHLLVLGLLGVTAGYVIIGLVVFDYARWFSSWASCMILIMHAAKTLPGAAEAPLIAANNRRNLIFGWLVTAIPRVGITKPL